MGETKWNVKSPAVKRILRELKEISESDNPDIAAAALEDNIFEWLFVIRGAWGTEFEGGIYHGRILMPAEYPFKPPAFVMMTPSGRFETKTKICLSISSYHPESWQPSWSVQSALVALIAFMQTPGNGAIGSMDSSVEARKEMAAESRTFIPQFVGNPERQAVIEELHEKMLRLEPVSKSLNEVENVPEEVVENTETATEPVADVTETEWSWQNVMGLLLLLIVGILGFRKLFYKHLMISSSSATHNNLVDHSIEL